MTRTIASAGLALFISSIGFGQSTSALPSFEVASVKVAEQPKPDAQGRLFIMRGCRGGPGSTDPGMLTCTNTPLKQLLVRAYDLKNYQVEGPAWLDTDGFDIVAKVPPGTSKEQFNLMLQSLLAERFKVTVHRETKNMQVYALSIGKGGPKLKEVDAATLEASKAAAATAPAPGRGGPPLPPPPPGAIGMSYSTSVSGAAMGRGGMPAMAKGPNARMGMMVNNGSMVRTLSGYITMTQLVGALSNALDRPVTDLTELTATYDIDLTWVPDGNDASMPVMRVAGAVAVGMAGGGDPGRGPAETASEPGLNLPQALQATLGLKLDQRKSPAEVLIVDHADKTPTEN
ncbi:MAG: TIGR03435 family protein [Bryobacteraceae bacterium]